MKNNIINKYLIKRDLPIKFIDPLSRTILKQELIENELDDILFRSWVRAVFISPQKESGVTTTRII